MDHPTPSLQTYVVEPRQAPALQSFVLLHGAGDNGYNFGQFLLLTQVTKTTATTTTTAASAGADAGAGAGAGTLADVFPRARFLFPYAARRVVARHGRATSTRWFDWWSLEAPEQREEVQVEGLRQSVAPLLALLREEAARVGAANVVLGGLSNGAAQALVALLLWEGGEPLAGALGMCGWLPYARKLKERAEAGKGGSGDGDGDVGEAGDSEAARDGLGPVSWLAKEIEWNPSNDLESVPAGTKKSSTPIFLGHGDSDQTVPWQRMPDAQASLEALGFEVRSETYEGLGHWYSGNMLGDVVSWLEPLMKTTVEPSK